jgi:hypothetical protein
MNRSLDLGMITNHRLLDSNGQSPELLESIEHSSKPVAPNPLLHTNRVKITITMIGWHKHK